MRGRVSVDIVVTFVFGANSWALNMNVFALSFVS